MRLFNHRPSPATILSFLALLVALSGSAYAAISIPANSVGTKHLRNGAVTTAKLHDGAVTSKKVKNGSLQSADFTAGQIGRGLRIVVRFADSAMHGDVGTSTTADAFCQPGERAVGGGSSGGSLLVSRPGVKALQEGPYPPQHWYEAREPANGETPNGWHVVVDSIETYRAYVVCVS